MERLVLIDCDTLLYKNIEDLETYKDRIDETIEKILQSVDATHYKCFIETRGNVTFRKVEFKTYKAKRKRQQLFNMEEIRDYIMEAFDPYVSIGVETDDSIISTWSYVKKEYPLTTVYIAGNDKDYLTYPVNYIDLYHKRFLAKEVISQEDANYNFMYQMLRGDTADNVKSLNGIGDKKAKQLLDFVPDHWISYTKLLLPLYKKQYKSSRASKNAILDTYRQLRLKTNVRHPKEFTETL